jgi:ATP-dependent phosphofructokinase / diphosphate-dependent phosphofructokinase
MKLGILCGGGPAPGINSVISAATIEARNSGWEVVGILDGFDHLIKGETRFVIPLSITDVSRIHVLGGSMLYTSRANPTTRDEGAEDPDWRMHNTVRTLQELSIDSLVTIGGDDTAFSAQKVAEAAGGTLKVAHVPKTIDNDLPLPRGISTFGFQTARHVGVEIVNNLMTDAMTTRRWFIVLAMGRSAGHLAVRIGKAAGATLTVIAEEFSREQPIKLSHLVDLVDATILKRMAHGRPFGVVILSEGIALRLGQQDLQKAMPDVERDEHGHIRLGELNLDGVLADLVKERFRDRGEKLTITPKNIGYELRCAPPIPFDIEYTRDLGYGAIDYLRKLYEQERGETGAMITVQEEETVPLPFGSFTDPDTGRPQVREVNVNSGMYRVATEYMIRLEQEDLDDPEKLKAIAEAARMSPQGFRERYGYLVEARNAVIAG